MVLNLSKTSISTGPIVLKIHKSYLYHIFLSLFYIYQFMEYPSYSQFLKFKWWWRISYKLNWLKKVLGSRISKLIRRLSSISTRTLSMFEPEFVVIERHERSLSSVEAWPLLTTIDLSANGPQQRRKVI